jgi:hypothetical protein
MPHDQMLRAIELYRKVVAPAVRERVASRAEVASR